MAAAHASRCCRWPATVGISQIFFKLLNITLLFAMPPTPYSFFLPISVCVLALSIVVYAVYPLLRAESKLHVVLIAIIISNESHRS